MIPVNPNNDNKDFGNEIIHAAVVTTQKVVDDFGESLGKLFIKNNVHLINIAPAESYGPDSVTLILSGNEDNIKKSLEQIIETYGKKVEKFQTQPISSLPPAFTGYFNDIEDNDRFNKLFKYCQSEYLSYCAKNNIQPHPEVLEG